jgi:hypothetical protein
MIFSRERAAASHGQRLASLIEAVRSTQYYGARLTCSPNSLERWLTSLPVLRPEDVQSRSQSFLSGRKSRYASEFRYPIQPSPEVVVLLEGFRPVRGLRVQTSSDRFTENLVGKALAAPVHVLRNLAVRGRRLDYPVVAFTGPLHGLLTDKDRDLFWRCFGVPAFEQWLGLGNEVLAEECEAHDSLHVRESEAVFESLDGELAATSLVNLAAPVLRLAMGLSGRIVDGGCLCGNGGLRLTNLTPVKTAAGTWCG